MLLLLLLQLFGFEVVSDPFMSPPVTHQAPLSLEFSRQEHWSGLPFHSLGDSPDPGSNTHLLHCKWILYCSATGEAQGIYMIYIK